MILFAVLLQILSCLNDPPPPFFHSWTFHQSTVLSEDTWQEWQELEGRDLWLGYENGGWETSGDERWAGRLIGRDFEVWLFHSETRQEYDILPFANTRAYADSQGNHYGVHPCGGWAVDDTILEDLIGK